MILVKEWKQHLEGLANPENIDVSSFEVQEDLNSDVWDEEKWAKETIHKSFKKRLALKRKHRIFETCMKNAFTIIPISNFLMLKFFVFKKKVIR